MQKYLILGKYTLPGLKSAAASRTKKAVAIVRKHKGRITAAYALVGSYDIAILAEFPGVQQLMKAIIALTRLTGVGFVSFPAISIEEFDKKILK